MVPQNMLDTSWLTGSVFFFNFNIYWWSWDRVSYSLMQQLHFFPLQLPCLSSYTPYCSNQVKAKSLLDQKKQDRRVQDFLQRCLQSPFSRKLDLWNFLDIPRSRLVKYPLLLREILKHTPNDHPDRQHLEEAVRTFFYVLMTKTSRSSWVKKKIFQKWQNLVYFV